MSDNNLEYEFVDFKTTPVDEAKIKEWLRQVSLDLLLNTKGTKYKTLKLKELNLNENQKIEWMTKENLLIKRPVIEFEDSLIVAFDEDMYKNIFTK